MGRNSPRKSASDSSARKSPKVKLAASLDTSALGKPAAHGPKKRPAVDRKNLSPLQRYLDLVQRQKNALLRWRVEDETARRALLNLDAEQIAASLNAPPRTIRHVKSDGTVVGGQVPRLFDQRDVDRHYHFHQELDPRRRSTINEAVADDDDRELNEAELWALAEREAAAERDEARAELAAGYDGRLPLNRVARVLLRIHGNQLTALFRRADAELRERGIEAVALADLKALDDAHRKLVNHYRAESQREIGDGLPGELLAAQNAALEQIKRYVTARPSIPDTPRWDKDTGNLFLGNRIVKRIKNIGTAKHVVRILDSFEELGWPSRIDDPLPYSECPLQLNDAIKSLNSGTSQIRFHADGTTRGITWERVA